MPKGKSKPASKSSKSSTGSEKPKSLKVAPKYLERFSLESERSTKDQIDALSAEHKAVFVECKEKWNSYKKKAIEYDDYMFLRFLRCSPGEVKFNLKASWKVMKNYQVDVH